MMGVLALLLLVAAPSLARQQCGERGEQFTPTSTGIVGGREEDPTTLAAPTAAFPWLVKVDWTYISKLFLHRMSAGGDGVAAAGPAVCGGDGELGGGAGPCQLRGGHPHPDSAGSSS